MMLLKHKYSAVCTDCFIPICAYLYRFIMLEIYVYRLKDTKVTILHLLITLLVD